MFNVPKHVAKDIRSLGGVIFAFKIQFSFELRPQTQIWPTSPLFLYITLIL